MKIGELDYAIRKALNVFDEWNDVTGLITKHTGYYYEAQACIADAVKIGAKVALFGAKADLDNLDNINK